jgi:cytochrome c-type biogenesis protein CcmH
MQIKCLGLLLILISTMALAAIDPLEFSSDEMRERFQELTQELRCPKCQNQNLAGSDSPISSDLRREVHRMLEAGMTDTQIKDYLVERYGTFVLYNPPREGATLWLWLLPVILVLVVAAVLFVVLASARRQALASGDLDEEVVE